MKTKCRLFLIIFLNFVFSVFVHAYYEGTLYQGYVGKEPITLSVNLEVPYSTWDDKPVVGRYFYNRYRQSIYLTKPKFKQKTNPLILTLEEFSYSEDTDTLGTLTLQPDGDGWKGFWQNTKKRLPISLKKAVIPTQSKAEPYPKELADQYILAQIRGLKFKKSNQENIMGYKIQWHEEPVTGIRNFEIISGYPKKDQDYINQHYWKKAWSFVADSLSCSGGNKEDYQIDTTLTLLTPQLVSTNNFENLSCFKAAHPDFDYFTETLYLPEQRPLTLEDIFWVGEPNEKQSWKENPKYDKSPADNKHIQYTQETLPTWLVKQLSILYPAEMASPNESECVYNKDLDTWAYASWYLTTEGIQFNPSTPSADRPCRFAEWALLPYSIVNKHKGTIKNINLP